MRYLPDQPLAAPYLAEAPRPVLTLGAEAASNDLFRLCAAVLSWAIGEGTSKAGGDIYRLQAAAILYAQCGGDELDARPHARAPTILRDMGLSRADVRDMWRRARAEAGYDAILDIQLLTAIWQPPVWRALGGLILDGPRQCARKIDQIVHQVAVRPAAAHAGGRTGATVSKQTISGYSAPLTWVMGTLVDLQQHGFPSELLAAWTYRPRVRLPRAPYANTDRSAPALRQVRLLWQELDAEIKGKLGAVSDEDELEIVRSCAISRLRHSGIWLPMRLRATLGLTFCLGGRSGAVCDLRRHDHVLEHEQPDGACGPAIALRPGKTEDEREIRWKPISLELSRLLEVLRITIDRILAETPDYTESEGRIERLPQPDDVALFPKSLRDPARAISQKAFYVQLCGYKARPRQRRKARAPLLPRRDGTGSSPHTLRKASMQAIKHAARDHLAEHHPDLTPIQICEALVDHGHRDDTYGYYDINTLHAREIHSGIATHLAWKMLTTHQGARPVRDSERYRHALTQAKTLKAEAERLRRKTVELLADPPRRQDLAFRRLLDLQALQVQRDEVTARLGDVEHEIERLRNDPASRIPAPDHLEDHELIDQFDQIERELNGQVVRDGEPELRVPVRNPPWLTIAETAEVVDVSYPQLARWANGQSLPFPDGDPRNPWQAHKVPIDTTLGPRRRRLAVSGINPRYLASPAQRRRLAEILAAWPAGWKEAHCTAPLQVRSDR